MPRSAPGPLTVRPSSSMLPAVGVSSPATIRRSVLLPQPEGPRMVMKSFSWTDRSVACSATVPPFAPGKVLETRLISRMVICLPSAPQLCPWEQLAVEGLEREIGDQADQPDDDDAEDDLVRGQQRLAVGDHVPDAAGRADKLRHDHIGPGPAQHHAQRFGDLGRAAWQQHASDDAVVAGAER